MPDRAQLEALEASGLDAHSTEALVVLAWIVSGGVPIDDAELKAGLRRAVLVLAAGGDPHRDVDLGSVAAERLAAELDTPERRAALAGALAALDTTGLPTVALAVATLLTEPELAWRSLAVALIADELADE